MPVEIEQALFGYRKRPVVYVEQLRLHAGRCVGVFGPNGAGKTTLARGIMGLLEPQKGKATRPPKLQIGYLPQHRVLDRHWPMSGRDAAAMALSARRRLGCIGNDMSLDASLRDLGVESMAERAFSELSGGQQQRLLLAGALASLPALLVLDEPTDGLDATSRQILLDALTGQMKRGCSVVMISHNVEDLMHLANEIAWLHPADNPDSPSLVEVIEPSALANRVVSLRRPS